MPQKKVTIAVADDDEAIRETVRDLLEEKGYAVKTASDGYGLLARVKSEPPAIIIMDIMMPEKNGLQIFSSIRDVAPRTKIIIYTGFQQFRDSIYIRTADRFLLKTDGPEVLLRAVEELL